MPATIRSLAFPACLPIFSMILLLAGCGGAPTPTDGADSKVTSMGSFEVTARLADIPGEFPPNDLYDYAYVMKYEVLETHRGDVTGTIYVGHYNPLKKRGEAADDRSGEIGGNITRYRVGDVHRLALDVPIEEYCMAGIVNVYAENAPIDAPVYWTLWVNEVVK